MAHIKDSVSHSKNTNLIKSHLPNIFREEHIQQVSQHKSGYTTSNKEVLYKRKEPQRFIMWATCYQNDERIQQETFVKFETKNITLPFCGLQKGKRKKRQTFDCNPSCISNWDERSDLVKWLDWDKAVKNHICYSPVLFTYTTNANTYKYLHHVTTQTMNWFVLCFLILLCHSMFICCW